MTLGGMTGPQTRYMFIETLKVFEGLYGVPAVGMTIMPDGIRAMRPWMSPVEYDALEKRLIVDRETIKFCGVAVSMGSAYTISG